MASSDTLFSITHNPLTKTFRCLGDACEDTCCQHWSMQMDEPTHARYRNDAPELLSAVMHENGGGLVMRRDCTTGQCVKLVHGLCGIHQQYGDRMLGDACYFYPRITRNLGSQSVMTLSPSCPEVVRLLLSLETPLAFEDGALPRLPSTLRDYLPECMTEAQALTVHATCLQHAMAPGRSAEASLADLSSVARSLPLLDPASWDQALPVYLRLAPGRLPAPELHPADPFHLLHALCGLVVASHKPLLPRLKTVIEQIEHTLHVRLDWQQVQIQLSKDSETALHAVRHAWQTADYDDILKRYLALELSAGLFPFAGLGNDAAERISFIGVRFATVKLALACAHYQNGPLPEAEIVRIIQSISRFLDHLGDAEFSRTIYQETGWLKEARLLALLA